jgi:glycosyltransferase involved in cell wall biosynthesis
MKGPQKQILFLDWRPNNRRATSLAQDIGAQLYLAPNVLRRRIYAPLRYFYLAVWTMILLVRKRPQVIIASAPPPFCPITVFAYTRLSKCPYVVDAAHLATMGFWSRIPFGFWFNKMIMNNGLITLVHNERIKILTDQQGIDSIVLETKVPRLQTTGREHKREQSGGDFAVMVPCSFDPDEPIGEVFEAASTMPETRFFITGDCSRLSEKRRQTCPANVTLTGFLSERDYDTMLRSVDAVLALSRDEYPVRPRAASEAIAAEKPLIVSQNEGTQYHLGKGAVLIDNTADGITQGISRVKSRYGEFVRGMKQLREERAREYARELQTLKDLLGLTI